MAMLLKDNGLDRLFNESSGFASNLPRAEIYNAAALFRLLLIDGIL